MAQSVEHFVHIEGVVGSSPTVTTQKSGRRYESTHAGFFLRTLLRTPKGTHEGYAEGTQKSVRTGTQMGYANAKKVRTPAGESFTSTDQRT